MYTSFKYLASLFLLYLCVGNSKVLADNYLVYGIPNYPPFSVYENEGFSGRDAELIELLAKKLELEIRYSPCEWVRCLALARIGQIDLLTSVSYAKKRETFLHFIQPAYSSSRILFIVPKGQSDHIDSLASLKHKIVGKETSARLYAAVDDDPDIKKYQSPDFGILFNMLLSGRIDTVMGGDKAIQIAVKQHGYETQLEPARFSKTLPSAYLAATRNSPRVAQHLSNLRAEMNKMHIQGELDYFIRWQPDRH